MQASALESAARRPAMLADSQWAALGSRLTTLERHLQVHTSHALHACLARRSSPFCPCVKRDFRQMRSMSVSLAGASAGSNTCCACCSRQQVHAAELPACLKGVSAWQDLATSSTTTPAADQASVMRLAEDVEEQVAAQSALLARLSLQVIQKAMACCVGLLLVLNPW